MNGAAEVLLPYLLSAMGGLLAALCAVLAWVGLQMKLELKEIGKEMKLTSATLTKIEKDLRGELGKLDRRVTRIEVHTGMVTHSEDTRGPDD